MADSISDNSKPGVLPFLEDEAAKHGLSTQSQFDLHRIDTWPRVLSVYDVPSESHHRERLFTYGLIYGTQPERVLEIGFRFGGSSFLMLCALEDVGKGKLVSVDPNPEPVLDFSQFDHRFTLIRGHSPEVIPRAVETLGGPVNLCFVDGNHSYASVRADLKAISPHMAKDSYILLHDPAYPDVQRATNEFIAHNRGRVIDCGMVCPYATPDRWSGLRLLRVTEAA